jgi:hypothetical protein
MTEIKQRKMIEDKEVNKAAEDVAKDMFADWLGDLEDKEQPTCSIDNTEDCEACGS